jgi:hypothetical protein
MFELPSCYGHEQRKARKDHLCCECCGTISKGEVYHFHHGVWDGRAASYKVCVDCEALKEEVDKNVKYDDERTPFERLSETVKEPLIERYMAIRWKRGAPIAPWLVAPKPVEKVNKEKSNG